MKYILALLLLCSCGAKDFRGQKFEYNILEIEGCEYIRPLNAAPHQGYTHKGNCSNPIHKCN